MGGQPEDKQFTDIRLTTENEIVCVSDVDLVHQPSQLLHEVRKIAYDLRNYEVEPTNGRSNVVQLFEMYYMYKPHREIIGDVLSECDYPLFSVNILRVLKSRGYFATGLRKLTNSCLWETSKHVFENLCNFSKASSKFVNKLMATNVLDLLQENIDQYCSKSLSKGNNEYSIMESSLCIIKNVVCKSSIKNIVCRHSIHASLCRFKPQEANLEVFVVAVMMFIAGNEAAQKLTVNQDAVLLIIHWINQSIVKLKDSNHLDDKFSIEDMVCALGMIAIEGNGRAFSERKVLQTFLTILKNGEIVHKISVTKCIWTISFNEEILEQIQECKELVKEMRRELQRTKECKEHAKETHQWDKSKENLIENLTGALWIILGRDNKKRTSMHRKRSEAKTVFVSFHADDTAVVLLMWQRLVAEGFIVSNDNKECSVRKLDAMASAVNRSSVIILCVSESFKLDNFCRTSVNYSIKDNKELIPVTVKGQCRLDGWLRALVEPARPQLEINADIEFEQNIQKIIEELQARVIDVEITLHNNTDNTSTRSASSHASSQDLSSCSSLHLLSINSEPESSTHVPKVLSRMKKRDVEKWLKQIGLEDCASSFKWVDGERLWQLQLIKINVPELFKYMLSEDYHLEQELLDDFSQALDDLIKTDIA